MTNVVANGSMFPPSVGDTETLVDSAGQSLLPPEEDPPIPPLPISFPRGHRPRLWHENPRADTPKREREDDETSTDSDLKGRDPKRRVSVKSDDDMDLAAPSDAPCPPDPVKVNREIAPFFFSPVDCDPVWRGPPDPAAGAL